MSIGDLFFTENCMERFDDYDSVKVIGTHFLHPAAAKSVAHFESRYVHSNNGKHVTNYHSSEPCKEATG